MIQCSLIYYLLLHALDGKSEIFCECVISENFISHLSYGIECGKDHGTYSIWDDLVH